MNTAILGPMFSGKSTLLLNKIIETISKSKNILLIKPIKDDRGYFTHNKDDISSLLYDNNIKLLNINEITNDILKEVSKYDYIFVDEFFMIKNCYLLAKELSKEIYFAGLLATSENKMFRETVNLLPYCENIIKLNGICSCGKIANYSLYKGKKEEEIVVGDEDKYSCVCKECYLKGNL